MKVFFCTACEAGLVFGDQRCDHCGEIVGTPQSLNAAEALSPTRLARIGAFFESQAGLSLTTLLIFLGLGIALVPVGWNYERLQAQTQVSSQVASRPAPDIRSSAGENASSRPDPVAPCHPLLVFFSETAMVGEVAYLLDKLGTSIAFGPDKNGAYQLAVSEKAAPGVAELLGREEDTVEGVFIKPRCGRP
jgi:hypothetical protein